MVPPPLPSKTVVVLGASYGGARAARLLSLSLPAGWKLVVIDRNSHMNHVYVFPRFTILPSHAPKAYVPYNNLLSSPPPVPTTTTSKPRANSCSSKLRPKSIPLPTPPLSPTLSTASSKSGYSSLGTVEEDDDIEDMDDRNFLQGTITSMTSHSVTFTRPHYRRSSGASTSSLASNGTSGTFDGPEETIYFDYAVYALGSGMPDPVNVWSEHPNMPSGIVHDHKERGLGTKKGGIKWMERKAEQLKKADRIVIVGGGALGIQFATDLKEIYPHKTVTLLHSRTRLMPLYPIAMHLALVEGLQRLGVEVVLGERVVTWPDEPENLDGHTKLIRTDKGREFQADLVLPCTGQKPHISVMAALSPSCISPITSRIRVHPTMQVSNGPTRPLPSRANTAEKLANLTLHPFPSPPISPANSEVDDDQEEQEVDDLSHIYAVGDCAETGAIQAGHTAYWQAEVAARNILRMIEKSEGRGKGEELEGYKPGPPVIKVSLGLKRAVTANGEEVKVTQDGVEDLHALLMWPTFQAGDLDMHT